MFCKKCGNEIESGMKFCKSCGAPVEKEEMTAQNSTPEQVVLGIRIGVIVACILMALSTVLPFVVFGREVARAAGVKSITLLAGAGDQVGDGIIYILLAITAVVFVCLKKKIPVPVCGALSALLYWIEVHQFKKQYKELLRGSNIDIWDYMEKGSGWHLLAVSIVLLLALGILYVVLERKGAKK